MRIKNPTKMEVDGLKSACDRLDCSMSEMIDAIMDGRGIRDAFRKQIEFNRKKAEMVFFVKY